MSDRRFEIIKELSKILIDDLLNYLNEETKKTDITLKDAFDIVLSAHISSLCTTMNFISIDDPKFNQTANKFCEKLSILINAIHPAGTEFQMFSSSAEAEH